MFTFCKPASSKKRFLPFREINQEFCFTLFEKAEDLPAEDWSAITGRKNIFLEKEYLQIIEKGRHSKLTCRYVLVYCKGKTCGIIYYQIVDFKAGIFGDLFSKQVEANISKRMNICEKYVDDNRDEVLLFLFTWDNNLVSGEYGFLFDKKIKKTDAHEILLEITDLVSKEEKLKAAISAVLIKDFYKALEPKELFKK